MGRTLLFDMQSGVSGDMILGALMDLGLDFEAWKGEIAKLGLPFRVTSDRVKRKGITAMRVQVETGGEQAHRTLEEIEAVLAAADLKQGVRDMTRRIFRRLAVAEAGLHGVEIQDVHFHELGALDSIVDIAGACMGFDMLGLETFYTTPFVFGTGTVEAAHGLLPLPAPATLALTEGFPSRRTGLPFELSTPTGAAVVTTLAKPLPEDLVATVEAVGYGAGSRELPDRPNVLRLCRLEEARGGVREDAYQVECNLDNMPAEMLAHAAGLLLETGCLDVWQEPIVMKKNRSGVKLCALVEPERLEAVLETLARETLTGGMRFFPLRRLVGEKSSVTLDTIYGRAELKVVAFSRFGIERRLPEFESLKALSARSGVPVHRIYAAVLAALAGDGAGP